MGTLDNWNSQPLKRFVFLPFRIKLFGNGSGRIEDFDKVYQPIFQETNRQVEMDAIRAGEGVGSKIIHPGLALIRRYIQQCSRCPMVKAWSDPNNPHPIHKTPESPNPNQRELIRQELRQRINDTLQSAQSLPPDHCRHEVRNQLRAMQEYCKTVEKTFIVVEQRITCDQYDLGGSHQDSATLFRGPNDDASVAICVTDKGSLLHRSSSPWRVFRNQGDIGVSQ